MSTSDAIDIRFDVRRDTPEGGDPDKLSPTLRRYHRLLWSKPLPSGRPFALVDTTPGTYLHHRSELGDFSLASDSVLPSFRKERNLSQVLTRIPEPEWLHFMSATYTIGGMMLFPANRVDGKMTLNGARGFHPSIKDRFDLTVECIRRHYTREASPLSDVIARYREFFALFEDFAGFVDFFLLQDLTAPDGTVRFLHAFSDFGGSSPVPNGDDDYRVYRERTLAFVEARNQRILSWCATNLRIEGPLLGAPQEAG